MNYDVVVIGAGQAGLAAGWQLRQAGLSFLILEGGNRAGGAWRDYYDSLTLFSPARYSALPGLPFPGDPGRYPQRDEVVAYLDHYAEHFQLPIRLNQRVTSVQRCDDGLVVTTTSGASFTTRAVIAASGAFGRPHVPTLQGLGEFKGRWLHSADYRSAEAFAGQRIVVVGGANSGVQIAYELASHNRVTLATRRPIRYFPQRFLGLDFHFWLRLTGLERSQWLQDESTPVLDDGRYRRAIRQGVMDRRPLFRRLVTNGVEWSDGGVEPVDTVILATGFRPNLDYLALLGVLNAEGRPLQQNGIATTVPGLYFVGLPKQRNFASATLRGVGADAAYLLPHLRRHLARAPASLPQLMEASS